MKQTKQTHKKALLIAALLSAVLAGLVFALSPAWGKHREQKQQAAILAEIKQDAVETPAAKKAAEKPEEKAPEKMLLPEIESISAPAQSPELETEAETEPETKPETARRPEEGAEVGILTIPKIDAELPVLSGVSKEQLKISEGWVRETDPVGSAGNAVIAGHRSYTSGEHFNRLEELEAGDEILFTAADGEDMRFLVSEILTAEPDDPAVFARPEDGEAQLTLYTCTPIKVATHRLIVRALRQED